MKNRDLRPGAWGLRANNAAMNAAISEFANRIEAKKIHSVLKKKTYMLDKKRRVSPSFRFKQSYNTPHPQNMPFHV